jgi:sorbitol-specific phosphotransferase system component IIC
VRLNGQPWYFLNFQKHTSSFQDNTAKDTNTLSLESKALILHIQIHHIYVYISLKAAMKKYSSSLDSKNSTYSLVGIVRIVLGGLGT